MPTNTESAAEQEALIAREVMADFLGLPVEDCSADSRGAQIIREGLKRYRTALATPTADTVKAVERAAGPWQPVGSFTPDPDAHYLVRGTLFMRIKRGSEIDADNVEAALIITSKADTASTGEVKRRMPYPSSGVPKPPPGREIA